MNGPTSHVSPTSALFLCSYNALRSPMAEGIVKIVFPKKIYADSAGIRCEPVDPFAVKVMEEMDVDLSRHRSKTIDDIEDGSFDLVVSLSPEAHHRALDVFHFDAILCEYWPTPDPSQTDGGRETILDAYRQTRDLLYDRIVQRFRSHPASHL